MERDWLIIIKDDSRDWPVLSYHGESEAEAVESWKKQTGRYELPKNSIVWSMPTPQMPPIPEHPKYPKDSLGEALLDDFVIEPRRRDAGEPVRGSLWVISEFLERSEEVEQGLERRGSLAWIPVKSYCGRKIYSLIAWVVAAEEAGIIREAKSELHEAVYQEASVIYYG